MKIRYSFVAEVDDGSIDSDEEAVTKLVAYFKHSGIKATQLTAEILMEDGK